MSHYSGSPNDTTNPKLAKHGISKKRKWTEEIIQRLMKGPACPHDFLESGVPERSAYRVLKALEKDGRIRQEHGNYFLPGYENGWPSPGEQAQIDSNFLQNYLTNGWTFKSESGSDQMIVEYKPSITNVFPCLQDEKPVETLKISFLDGPSLAKKIPRLTRTCSQMDVAMAYVKIGGLRTLLRHVEDMIKRKAPIRIVFGLSSSQGITDEKSAEALLRLSKRKNITVKRWNNPGFHPKLLIFHGDRPCVVVGSSNLTGAAQSTNAEANILVENAYPQLMRDSVEFFEHYFKPAPVLHQGDIKSYKPRTDKGNKGQRSGLEEDDLPSPLQRLHDLNQLRPKNIWKIPPGEDAKYWEEWLNMIDDDGEGLVALGWHHTGSLDNFKSYDSLRKAVEKAAETVWDVDSRTKTQIKYVTDQLWTFKTSISKGDVFLVYSESRLLGVAEVTDESRYRHWGVKTVSYGHQMNVRYWWFKQWPKRADDRIVETLGKHGTLRPIVEPWFWKHLLSRIRAR